VALGREVLALLSNGNIKKIGADVKNDIRALTALRHFKPQGFIDLQDEVEKYGIENRSLRKISGIVLGKKVSKAQRLSNWEAKVLTPQQQMYAATDAWVCIEIYNHLKG
jgi:ribonuclease D